MNKQAWIKRGLCLMVALCMLVFGGMALSEGGGDEAAAPQFTVTNPTVAIGEFFEVDVSAVEGAAAYRALLIDESIVVQEDPDEQVVWSARAQSAGKIYLTTAQAHTGTFTMKVAAYSDKATANEISRSDGVTVTITDNDQLDEGVLFRVAHREDLKVGDFLYASIYAPGSVDTFISAADSEMHWNTVVRELNCAGTIHVSATAVFADGRVVDREADVQVASEGAAGTIHLGDVTTRVHAGEDIVGSYGFSLTQGVQARNVVELYDPLRGGDVYYSDEDQPGDIHIPGRGDDGASLLEAGRAYTLYVGLEPTTRGYEKVYETIQVVVDGETDEDHQVTLTVAGQTDSVGVPNHQEVLIVISAPDASAVRLFRGGELERLDRDECHYWNDEDGIEARLSWSPWQTGTLYAEACYGDPDDGNAQWVMSNVVLLRVDTGNGTLPVPDVSMPRTVNRGDMLTIEIDRGESPAQWYWADMNRDDEEYTHVFHADTDTNEFHIPTAQLAPGVYDVTVGAGAEGFEDNTVSRFVTINGDEADPTQAVWNFSGESAQTMESFAFSVYVPQAQSIHADMLFTDGWEVHEDEEGDLFYRNDYSFPVGGTFTVNAVAAFGDGHTEEFTRTFEITSDGALDSIELTAPGALLLGNDLEFSFTEAAEAENYHVRICPADEGWNAVYETDMDQAGTVTLSTGDVPDIGLEDGRRYVISVMATARNRDAASAEAELFSYRQAQSEHTVTLTVNGSSEAAQVMAQEDMAVVVEAEGADYVRWFDGYNWREDMRLRAGSDRQYVAWPNTTDSFTMYARAWYSTSDEDGYFVYSSPVNVTVETPGEVGGYTLTVPDTVEWGSPLTVTLGKAEHAREYHVRIENVDGREYFFFCPQPGTLYLPTRMLEPDNEYRVTVNARGGVGYSWRFEERRFTVTGEKTASPAMTLSAASILPQEDLLATGSVPGAAKLRLYVDGGRMTWEYDDWEDEDTWYTWSGDVGSDTFCFESGSHTFAVSGLVNGEWTEPVSAAVTVTAGGALAAADVVMNGTVLMEGQDLEISVAPVKNAQDYHIYIHREGTDGDDTVMSLSGLIPNKTYTFSGSLFETGWDYRVDVDTNAPGYVSGHRNARFTVMPNVEPAEGATLTAHVDEGTTLPIYGNFRVTVDVADENATAYMVYDGDGGWDVDVNLPDDEGRYEYRPYDNPWFSFGENGTYTLFAKYTTDTFEPWQEGWEDTVTWHYTNSANVTVTTEDELPAPRISVPATVQRGQLLEIEIANAADYLGRDNLSVRADPYHAGEDRRYGDNYEWNDNGVIYMPTAELEAGRVYTLYVHASAVNCRMVTTQTQFTVTEPDEPLDRVVWAVNEQEISTMAPVTMAIYAENAHQIDLEVFDSNGSRCNEWHEGRGELYISSWMSDVAGEYRFVARVYFDGEDEPQTEERTVTVTAENGPLGGERHVDHRGGQRPAGV